MKKMKNIKKMKKMKNTIVNSSSSVNDLILYCGSSSSGTQVCTSVSSKSNNIVLTFSMIL